MRMGCLKGIKHLVATVTLLFTAAILTSTYVNAEILTKYMSSGKTVSTSFYSDSGKKHINGYLSVSEAMFKDGPGTPDRQGPMGFISVDIFDPNMGISLFGFGDITLDTCDISNNLHDAHVVGTAVVRFHSPHYPPYPYPPYPYPPYPPYPTVPPPDVVDVEYAEYVPIDPNIHIDPNGYYPPYPPPPIDPNGYYPPYPPPPTIEEISLDITWTTTGEFMTGHYKSHSSYGDIRMNSRYFGRFSDAVTKGSITGTTFSINIGSSDTPYGYYPYDPNIPYYAPYSNATIGKFKNGYMVILKP